MNNREHHHLLFRAQADALATRIVLDELRAGRLPNALELLEQHLDTSVLTLHRFAQDADTSGRQQATDSLRNVRDYRRRHPRKTEAAIDDTPSTLQTQKRVQEILDETL